MNKVNIAFASVAALGLMVAGTVANAEPVRSAAAVPGVVSAKKLKLARTAAPKGRESNAAPAVVPMLLVVAGTAAGGFGFYQAVDKKDSPGT